MKPSVKVPSIRLGGRQVLQLAEGFEPSDPALPAVETALNLGEILEAAGLDADTVASELGGRGRRLRQHGLERRGLAVLVVPHQMRERRSSEAVVQVGRQQLQPGLLDPASSRASDPTPTARLGLRECPIRPTHQVWPRVVRR